MILIPCIYTILFVFSIYIWKYTKRFFGWHKNDKAKTLFVSIMVLLIVISENQIMGNCYFFECFSFNFTVYSIIYPLFINTLLFLGSITQSFLDDEITTTLQTMNLLKYSNLKKFIIAPVVEEITFRICFYKHFQSITQYYYISSLLFSLAHANHVYRIYRKNKQLLRSIIQTCFILMYTLIFGYYSAVVYQNSQSLISICILHGYCNFLGFPKFNLLFQRKKSEQYIIGLMYALGICLFFVFI